MTTIKIRFAGDDVFQKAVFDKLKKVSAPFQLLETSEHCIQFATQNYLVFVTCIDNYSSSTDDSFEEAKSDIVIGNELSLGLIKEYAETDTLYHFCSPEDNVGHLLSHLITAYKDKMKLEKERNNFQRQQNDLRYLVKLTEKTIADQNSVSLVEEAKKKIEILKKQLPILELKYSKASQALKKFYQNLPEFMAFAEAERIKSLRIPILTMLDEFAAHPERINSGNFLIYRMDDEGKTVYDYAIERGYYEVLFQLICVDDSKLFALEKGSNLLAQALKEKFLQFFIAYYQHLNALKDSAQRKDKFVDLIKTTSIDNFYNKYTLYTAFVEIPNKFEIPLAIRRSSSLLLPTICEQSLRVAIAEFKNYLNFQKQFYVDSKSPTLHFIDLLLGNIVVHAQYKHTPRDENTPFRSQGEDEVREGLDGGSLVGQEQLPSAKSFWDFFKSPKASLPKPVAVTSSAVNLLRKDASGA